MSTSAGTLAVRILVAVVVCAATIEGGVRLRQWLKYGTAEIKTTARLTVDEKTGLKVPKSGKLSEAITINSDGFRSPELEKPKPESTIRLAFMGGSTTFCAEVSSNEKTWPHIVWERLQKEYPERRIDYVNAGIPGYRVAQSLQNLEQRVAPLNPDVVVIYDAKNDLMADTRELAKEQGIDTAWGDEEVRDWLSEVSLVWYLVRKNMELFARRKAAATGKGRLVFEPATLSAGFEARLTELVEAAQTIAPVVAVVTFSYKLRREQPPEKQLENAEVAIYYAPYMDVEGLLDAFDEYNRVIREVARETGAILIDQEMSIPADSKHFTDTVHFSDEGSERMAFRVVKGLLEAKQFRQLMRRQSAQSISTQLQMDTLRSVSRPGDARVAV